MTATGWSPTDSAYQAHLLRAHEDLRAHAEGSTGRSPVRAAVLASWRRSLTALPGHHSSAGSTDSVGSAGARAASTALEGDLLAQAREAHLFSTVLPLLRSRLIEPAVEAGLMVALGDARGRLLWVEGRPQLISAADDMGFAAGADWSETAMGTSAPALALTTSSAMQVVGAEHFHEAVHPWSCSAVPVLHPLTRQTLGVIDVTGGAEAVSPLVLPLLEATARAVQEELRIQLTSGAAGARPDLDTSSGAEPSARASARPRILPPPACIPAELLLTGRRTPLLRTGGRSVELSGRHAELLAILHLSPDGITGAELAEALHGTTGTEGTVRAEVVRLRRLLASTGGPEIVSRPYRLERAIDSDLLRARTALDRGEVEAALVHCTGELLPASDAPAIRRLARELGSGLRELLLERGTSEQLWRYAQRPDAAHDLEILMTILQLAPAGAPERAAAAARARDLRGEGDPGR